MVDVLSQEEHHVHKKYSYGKWLLVALAFACSAPAPVKVPVKPDTSAVKSDTSKKHPKPSVDSSKAKGKKPAKDAGSKKNPLQE